MIVYLASVALMGLGLVGLLVGLAYLCAGVLQLLWAAVLAVVWLLGWP